MTERFTSTPTDIYKQHNGVNEEKFVDISPDVDLQQRVESVIQEYEIRGVPLPTYAIARNEDFQAAFGLTEIKISKLIANAKRAGAIDTIPYPDAGWNGHSTKGYDLSRIVGLLVLKDELLNQDESFAFDDYSGVDWYKTVQKAKDLLLENSYPGVLISTKPYFLDSDYRNNGEQHKNKETDLFELFVSSSSFSEDDISEEPLTTIHSATWGISKRFGISRSEVIEIVRQIREEGIVPISKIEGTDERMITAFTNESLQRMYAYFSFVGYTKKGSVNPDEEDVFNERYVSQETNDKYVDNGTGSFSDSLSDVLTSPSLDSNRQIDFDSDSIVAKIGEEQKQASGEIPVISENTLKEDLASLNPDRLRRIKEILRQGTHEDISLLLNRERVASLVFISASRTKRLKDPDYNPYPDIAYPVIEEMSRLLEFCAQVIEEIQQEGFAVESVADVYRGFAQQARDRGLQDIQLA